MARAKKTPSEAGVDNYPPRPLEEALRSEEDHLAVENIQPDQIADYHETHPTLKVGKAQQAEPPTLEDGDSKQ